MSTKSNRGRVEAWGLAWALVAALAGCTSSTPTQIVATIEGDASIPVVAVEVDGEERARTSVPTPAGDGLPLTLTLVHGGGGLGPIAVSAVGYASGGQVVARDCELATFRRGAIAEVELTLTEGTIVECPVEPGSDGGSTMMDGGSATCDPAACAATDPSAVCVGGRCVIQSCPSNQADCDPDRPGCETMTRNDPLNCGGCDVVCASGRCKNGRC